MSGYYSRQTYDACVTNEDTKISAGPGRWSLNTIQEHGQACFAKNGPRDTRPMASAYIDINYAKGIDIESSLKGIDIPLSRCVDERTLIERDQKLNKLRSEIEKNGKGAECKPSQEHMQASRLAPFNGITEMAFNRYEFPIIDPREKVYNGSNMPYATDTEGSNRSGRSSRIDYRVEVDPYLKALRQEARKTKGVVAHNSWQTLGSI